jgi:hypothetical protein
MKNVVFLLVLFFSFSAFGQTLDSLQQLNKKQGAPLNSDRPGATYSANTVGKGAFMTQFGLDIGGHRLYKWDVSSSSVKAGVDLRYGIGENLEIGSFISGTSNNINTNLIEDTQRNNSSYSLNLRYTALSNDVNSLGFLGDVAYGHDRQNNYMTYSAKALYAISLNNVIGLSSNLGYNYSEGTSWANYTLNLGFGLYDDFGFYVESFGDFGGGTDDLYIDGGIWYLIGPNVQLDMLFTKGFNNNVQDLIGAVGVTWRLIEPK